MRFTTASGSQYLIDFESKRICRLMGNLPPTERQGEGWRAYASLFPETPVVGQSLLITWSELCEPLPETVELIGSKEKVQGSTITSKVISILESPSDDSNFD